MQEGEVRVSPPTVNPLVELDVVGVIEGADKSSAVTHSWDYLRHYEQLFAPLRHQEFNLLEVGIKSGISLKLWEWFFPHATIVGIDIDPKCKRFVRPRVQIAIGSQADATFLRRTCQANKPTLFIDDGSHLAQHNIFTFETVFPLMQPGGIYIIEDLAFHFGPDAPRWQGSEPRNIIGYVLDLGRSCMARHFVAGSETVAPGMAKLIDSVQFIGSAAIIRRRHSGRDVTRAMAFGRDYMEAHDTGAAADLHFASFVLRHGGDLGTARAACARAIAGGEETAMAYMTMGDITLRLADHPASQAALARAASLPNDNIHRLQNLANLQEKAGMADAAAATLRKILAAHPNHAPSRERLAALSAT